MGSRKTFFIPEAKGLSDQNEEYFFEYYNVSFEMIAICFYPAM